MKDTPLPSSTSQPSGEDKSPGRWISIFMWQSEICPWRAWVGIKFRFCSMGISDVAPCHGLLSDISGRFCMEFSASPNLTVSSHPTLSGTLNFPQQGASSTTPTPSKK